MKELVQIDENIKRCPNCKVTLKKKREKLQFKIFDFERKKEVLAGKPWYHTREICPKCGKEKCDLVAELRRKKEKEIPKCPKCKIKMTRCRFEHHLMRGQPDSEKDGELIAKTFVSNPCYRCKKCGHKIKAKWGTNIVAILTGMGRGSIFFPPDWLYNTFSKEVWVDLKKSEID